jgi:putative membrane protein
MKTMIWKTMSLVMVFSGLATWSMAQPATVPPQARPANASSTAPAPSFPQRWLDMLTAQQFVTDAAMGGMKEVRLSEIALAKTQNAGVKAVAQRMITDHSQANAKLRQLAEQKGLTVPAENTFAADDANWNNPLITGAEPVKDAYLLKTDLALADYQDFRQLKSLSGREFDQAYARDMVMDHENTIIEFEAASRLLTDPELKAFAEQTLPTLRMHQQMVRKLNDQLAGQTAENENGKPAGNEASAGSDSMRQ